ncbi:MAG: hypothetical protein ACKOSS_06800 [Planctomycetia bacterium]
MRALILLLAGLVVALAIPVLWHEGGGARQARAGEAFAVGQLVANAQVGEEAVYTDQDGNRLVWTVERRTDASAGEQQRVMVRRRLYDKSGQLADPRWGDMVYEHDVLRHGWFPLMAPQDPQGYDRLWVWARIRRDQRVVHGKQQRCWRVDAVDPGLPPEADGVLCWFHEQAPVFGLVEWTRGGRTWTLVGGRGGGS